MRWPKCRLSCRSVCRAPPVPVSPPATEEPKKEEKANASNKKVQQTRVVPVQAVADLDVLKETRVDRMHLRGQLGTGIRVAIIDTDFTGWEKFVGSKLPKTTVYIDLTAERNREIQPEPSRRAPAGSATALTAHWPFATRPRTPTSC